MNLLSSPFLMKIHLYSAAFILPVALLFLSTGFLIFLYDIEGDYYRTPFSVSLTCPLVRDESALEKIVLSEMEKLGLEKPEGWTRIKELDSDPWYQFEYHDGINRIIKLMPTNDPLMAELVLNEASLYRKFVMLHAARGNIYFRLYALVFALVLFSMLVTGYLLAWRLKQYRNPLLLSSTVSLFLFIVIVAIQ
jgi:hypothetical protein